MTLYLSLKNGVLNRGDIEDEAEELGEDSLGLGHQVFKPHEVGGYAVLGIIEVLLEEVTDED